MQKRKEGQTITKNKMKEKFVKSWRKRKTRTRRNRYRRLPLPPPDATGACNDKGKYPTQIAARH